MTEQQLKNCPFCDGKAYFVGSDNLCWVTCRDCQVETNPFRDEEQDKAIAAWNRRVADNPPTDEYPVKVLFKSGAVINKTADGWMDISTAPRDGTEVLTVVIGFKLTIGWWNDQRWVNQVMFDDEDIDYNPTHWMPLPKPPTNT